MQALGHEFKAQADDPTTLCNLGLSLSTMPQFRDEAILAFEEAAELSPGDPYIIQNFLICLLEWGHEDRFRVLWKHAIRIMPQKQLLILSQMFNEFQTAIKGENAEIEPLEKVTEIMGGRKDSYVQQSLSGLHGG